MNPVIESELPMLFNTFEFWGFFALCFGLYAALPHRAQNRMLLLASYVFYAAWDWRFCSLLALSTAVDYAVGLGLGASEDPRRRRRLVSLSLCVNLGVLGFFKYANFFEESLRALLGDLGAPLPDFAFDVVLPVGISFYTFQTLSYTIDVYRRRLEPIHGLLDFGLFVAFFPPLVAGPIERAGNLLPQILERRELSWERLGSGSWLALWGLFKKVVIADNLAGVVDLVYAPGSSPTGAEVWIATYAFAFQIYCDFSGYTDIARGISRMMGFDLMLNFNLPYAATSPTDFWRRWHISLSTWLRDYLYIPLGGNRSGRWNTAHNLSITMLLGGLWHGAAWTFVIWGGYHGALLMAHRALRPALERVRPGGAAGRAAWRSIRTLVTFHLVCLGWMIFRAESLGALTDLLAAFGDFRLGSVAGWLLPFTFLVAPLLLMQAAEARSRNLEAVLRWPFAARVAVYFFVLTWIIVFGEEGGEPFIYFQF
jgi:D-alanyl-lipoteichoic acid acyltransferase DltB (MBOAT superfamily)